MGLCSSMTEDEKRAAAASEQEVPLTLLPYFNFLNERGQKSIMNQLMAQFSQTSINGGQAAVPRLPVPPVSYLPRPFAPLPLGVPMMPGLHQQLVGGVPGQSLGVAFGALSPGSQPGVAFAQPPPAPAPPGAG